MNENGSELEENWNANILESQISTSKTKTADIKFRAIS